MPKEIKEEVLKVISNIEKGSKKFVLRVVQWGKGSPTLEKREQYEVDGEVKNGKAKGLNKEDFELILQNKDEISKLLNG